MLSFIIELFFEFIIYILMFFLLGMMSICYIFAFLSILTILFDSEYALMIKIESLETIIYALPGYLKEDDWD